MPHRHDRAVQCMPTLNRGEGFSLVEVVVAMLMLALMAMALIPLMLSGTRLSVDNRSLAAATAFANSQLSEVQAAFSNDTPRACSALTGYMHRNVPDPAGTGLIATRSTLTACGSDQFSTVTVEVVVADAREPTVSLVKLTTKVLVERG